MEHGKGRATAVRQEIKYVRIGKEGMNCLIPRECDSHIENPKAYTEKPLERIRKFSEVLKYQINGKKINCFIYK